MTSNASRPFGATVALLLAASAHPTLALPADFKEKADHYVKSAWPSAGPGAAVIVTEGGKTVYARGQGLADVETGKPIGPDTVFRLGSITKQLSAAVLLQLVDEGKLSLDDPVSKFVPSLPQPGAGATVRQLLNHTVGVQSYTGIPGWMVEANTNRPYTTAEMISLFKDLPAPSKPGEQWSYNNSGYVLVGAVIEAVTGKAWHQVVGERIAKPLRLQTLRYGVGEASMPNMAKGYTDGEAGPKPAMKIHMSVPHAAGALVGSVEDIATWAHALHHGKVVGKASYGGMIAPTKTNDGKSVPYGYGLGLEKVRGRDAIGHGGGIFGFSTDSLYIPEKDIFVAVFTNSDDPATSPGVAAKRLAALAIGDPFPALERTDVDAKSLEPLFGVYRGKEGEAERSFFMRDGQLYTQRAGGPEMKVYAAGGDRFFYGPNSLTWFAVRRYAGGAHAMEMHQQGANEAETSLRAGPIPAAAAAVAVPRGTLERYVGSYAIGRGEVKVAWGAGDALTIEVPGEGPKPMRAVSPTEFSVDSAGALVRFEEENAAIARMVVKVGEREMKAERVPSGS